MAFTLSIVLVMTGLVLGSDGVCRTSPHLALVNWVRLEGMWYNTASTPGDSYQVDNYCSTMVIAGRVGFDGAAIFRNFIPKNGFLENGNGASFREFLGIIDPGVYHLDPTTQIEWMNIQHLETMMPRGRIANFMNTISKQYTRDFEVYTDYVNFLVLAQCDCDKHDFWVFTRSTGLSNGKREMLTNFLQKHRLSGEIQQNRHCTEALKTVYDKEEGKKPQ